MNFRIVLPYLELLIRNGLIVRIEGDVPIYEMMPKGSKALKYFRELEVLIPEMRALLDKAI